MPKVDASAGPAATHDLDAVASTSRPIVADDAERVWAQLAGMIHSVTWRASVAE